MPQAGICGPFPSCRLFTPERRSANPRCGHTVRHLWPSLYRRSRGEALSGLGLRTGQNQILRQLWRQDVRRLSELVERLNVSSPTLTRALNRMQRDGLLERRRDPEDARSSRVYLSGEGRALRGPVERLWAEIEEQTMSGLSDEEQLSLRRLLLRSTATSASSVKREAIWAAKKLGHLFA